MTTITLTIKKVFFDKIAALEKRIEYRQANAYFRKIFEQVKPTKIKFHYQKRLFLTVDIKNVQLIPKPEHLQNSPFLPTSEIFAIEIENPTLSESEFFTKV